MHTDIAGLLSGSGYAPIAVIGALILLEELGVPMPFAPGDVLLVLAGASIATGHVNPLVVLASTYVSALVGAVCGRELFERIGIHSLPRLAALLHAGHRIDDLTAKLRRGGSGAVFVGRLTPGLRIVTTYAAGLTALPRRTFLIGLAPGVAVYQAVFLSLGFWLGPTALTTIERHAPNSAELILVVALVVTTAVVAHRLAKRLRVAIPKRRASGVASSV